MKKIDDWEQESILKIQQTANDIRQELKHVYTKHTLEISESFTELKKLHELKKDFQTSKTINIHYDENKQSFINKIKLSQISFDSFHLPVGDIQTINNGFIIIHGSSNGDATFRGKKEYHSGTHRLRFHIEKLGIPKWVFFGIISKNAPLQSTLHKTSSVYGWAGYHQVWLNGKHHHRYDGYKSEIDINKIIELFIDCDGQKICLTNESTLTTHEIDISIINFAFPWTLYIGLYGANDRIRLLLA